MGGEGTTSKKRELLESKMSHLERALEELPKGKLTCARNGCKGNGTKASKEKRANGSDENYVKWYVSTGKGRVYLPKKERELAEGLALRKLYTIQLARLRHESELLRQYELFQEDNVYSNEIENLISQESPYYELVKKRIVGSMGNDTYIKAWQEEEYRSNCAHSEHLQHKSLKGERLRSKSEVIIANALYVNHIPYRYECELVLGDVTLYPDFTILHPGTLEVYYWEHFGMMHQEVYKEKTLQKIRLYGEYEIFPFHNLITTYESEFVALDSEMIQKIIGMFFVC